MGTACLTLPAEIWNSILRQLTLEPLIFEEWGVSIGAYKSSFTAAGVLDGSTASPPKYTSEAAIREHALRSLCLVSRRTYGLAKPWLYFYVVVRDGTSLGLLLRTFLEQPSTGSLVRRLALVHHCTSPPFDGDYGVWSHRANPADTPSPSGYHMELWNVYETHLSQLMADKSRALPERSRHVVEKMLLMHLAEHDDHPALEEPMLRAYSSKWHWNRAATILTTSLLCFTDHLQTLVACAADPSWLRLLCKCTRSGGHRHLVHMHSLDTIHILLQGSQASSTGLIMDMPKLKRLELLTVDRGKTTQLPLRDSFLSSLEEVSLLNVELEERDLSNGEVRFLAQNPHVQRLEILLASSPKREVFGVLWRHIGKLSSLKVLRLEIQESRLGPPNARQVQRMSGRPEEVNAVTMSALRKLEDLTIETVMLCGDLADTGFNLFMIQEIFPPSLRRLKLLETSSEWGRLPGMSGDGYALRARNVERLLAMVLSLVRSRLPHLEEVYFEQRTGSMVPNLHDVGSSARDLGIHFAVMARNS